MHRFEGIGIHSGSPCKIRVELLPDARKIVFLTPNGPVPAAPESISDTSFRCTRLSSSGAGVSTVEHLLAAIGATGQGASIEVDGPEIPAIDGSSGLFWDAFKAEAKGFKRFNVPSALNISQSGSSASITPVNEGQDPIYSVLLTYNEPSIGPLSFSFRPFTDDFAGIAEARTFALQKEVDTIFNSGGGSGGSLENALVLGEHRPLNPGGKRYEDEPARHKMLDLVGDLMLLGALPFADVEVSTPGHRLNHEIVRTLYGN